MSPKPWASGEMPWRRYIADKCAVVRRAIDNGIDSAEKFTVSLTFLLGPNRCADSDLDNLAKPVLDTVFLIARPQTQDATLTGALINANDCRISKLIIEKQSTEDTTCQGVDIIIEWSKGDVDQEPSAVL